MGRSFLSIDALFSSSPGPGPKFQSVFGPASVQFYGLFSFFSQFKKDAAKAVHLVFEVVVLNVFDF